MDTEDHARRMKGHMEHLQDILTQFNTGSMEKRLAIREVTQTQREIRQMKKEVDLAGKQIRTIYKNKYDNVTVGCLVTLIGRGAVRKETARQRRVIQAEMKDALEPYAGLKTNADEILISLDRLKLDIEQAEGG